MKNFILSICLISASLSIPAFAQNGKPKVKKYKIPKYPAAARATLTQGEVLINVKISAHGIVTGANAESGHPLLRQAAETAALRWIFSSNKESEREAKVTFAFYIENNKNRKNNYRETDYKTRFRKPYRLELKALIYPQLNF